MFAHYIAIDWAKSNMAVARMTPSSDKTEVFEGPASIKKITEYLIGSVSCLSLFS